MKKFISFIMTVVLISTTLFSCSSSDTTDQAVTSNIAAASSSAESYALWLSDRLGDIDNKIVVGIGDNSKHGVILENFEDDGYIIRTVGDTTAIFGKTDEGLDIACRKYVNELTLFGKVDDLVYHEGLRIDSLNLFGTPINLYTIVFPTKAGNGMEFAVSELQRLINVACGANLTAVSGSSNAKKTITLRISDGSDLGADGFRYFEEKGSLIIEGGSARGCLGGVYAFFENECGWQGLTLGDSELADAASVDVPLGISYTEHHAFDSLGADPALTDSFDSDRLISIEAETAFGTVAHADSDYSYNEFADLIDLDTESFCFSSDDFYISVRNAVRVYLNKKKMDGFVIGDTFKEVDLSVLSSKEYCTCDKCGEILSAEGSTAGSAVRFFNKLSDEMTPKFPGIVFKTIINACSENAPVSVPCDNLYITLRCNGCGVHALSGESCTSDGGNSGFGNAVEGWLDVTDNICVLLGCSDSLFVRFSVLDTLYSDIRYLNELGVKNIGFASPNYPIDVQRIEYQLITLMNRDIHMTEAEFEDHLCRLLEKEYGFGWTYIREYINLRISEEKSVSCRALFTDNPGIPFSTEFCANNFDTAISIFEKALTLTCNRNQEKMCELLSVRMYYEGCFSLYYPIYFAEDSDGIEILDARYSKAVDILKKHGLSLSDLSVADNLYGAAWEDWLPWKGELYTGDEGFVPPESYLDVVANASEHVADDNLTFAFKTDSHYSAGESTNGLEQFGYLQRYIPLDFYAHGGDIINGDHKTGAIAAESLSTAFTSMLNVHNAPMVSLRGNHDDNSWPFVSSTGSKYDVFPKDDILNTDQWRELAFTRSSKIVTDGKGCYGYMDHEGSKIRVLFVDTSDLPYEADENGYYKYGSFAGHGIRNDQLNFMAEAMTFSDKGEDGKNWAILIISHVPIETMRTPTSPYRFGIPDTLPRNDYAFLRLVKAYQTGSVFNETQTGTTNYGDGGMVQGSFNDVKGDFAYSVYADFSKNGPGEVIGFICGHTHTDNLATNVGMVSYSGANNKIYPKLSDGYVYISCGPTGFSVITVDRDTDGCGTIYVDKYGSSIVARKDMIAPGDNATVSTDPVIAGITSTEPDTGSVASGHYSVNYSQNP